MITTITLNPAIDKTISLNNFQHGSVNRVASVREDIGGKGINVSKILQALGDKTCASGFIGENNQAYVKDLLYKEALYNDFISVKGETRLNTKIVELDTGITTDINELGFHISKEESSKLERLIVNYAKKSDLLVFSGSLPQGMDPDTYGKLLSLVAPFTKTALDADGVFLLEGLKASPYIIKPNIHELENAISEKLESHEDIKLAARRLIQDYKIQFVLVSMGGDGSILVAADKAFFAKALKVKVKSSVGAGDSMLAGFIYGLTNKKDLRQALAYATACGALAVSQEGTQTFKKEDVVNLLDQVEIKSF